jgi:putative membrane protein
VRPSRWLFGALCAAQVAYGRVERLRTPAGTRGLVGLMLAASAAEATEARGLRRGALPLGAAGALGFVVELVGVATGRPFGRYAYSERLGPRVGGVPLLAAAAWALMARPAWVTAGWAVGRRRALRVPLAAGALTAWDVFLDPRMVRDGYWSWPDGGRYEDVPASNFLGWFATGLGVFAAWAALEGRGDPPGRRDDDLPAHRPDEPSPAPRDDGALALYVWTWIGETFANAVLWRRPVTAAAGTVAMGAVAVPALVRRLRP